MDPLVRSLPQPRRELPVEVGDTVEAAARQEARLEVAVGPLDQTLGFRVGRGAQLDGDAVATAERLELVRQALPAGAPAADARLLVPHPQAWHPTELAEHLPHPAQHVRPGA